MSNARYFADGVDFYRVKYENDSTEGPYTSIVSARRQGKSMVKVRENWRGWGESRFLHSTYQIHTEYKIQKLEPVYMECSGNPPCMKDGCGSLCIMVHGLELKWLDVEE